MIFDMIKRSLIVEVQCSQEFKTAIILNTSNDVTYNSGFNGDDRSIEEIQD